MFKRLKRKPAVRVPIEYMYGVAPIIDAGVRWYKCEKYRYIDLGMRIDKITVSSDYFETREEADNWVDEKRLITKALENNDD